MHKHTNIVPSGQLICHYSTKELLSHIKVWNNPESKLLGWKVIYCELSIPLKYGVTEIPLYPVIIFGVLRSILRIGVHQMLDLERDKTSKNQQRLF